MKTCVQLKENFHDFLTSALVWNGVRSALSYGRLTFCHTVPGTQWMGHTAGLNEEQNVSVAPELESQSSTLQTEQHSLLRYWVFTSFKIGESWGSRGHDYNGGFRPGYFIV
jgi:hypothetical protein